MIKLLSFMALSFFWGVWLGAKMEEAKRGKR